MHQITLSFVTLIHKGNVYGQKSEHNKFLLADEKLHWMNEEGVGKVSFIVPISAAELVITFLYL